MITGNEQAKGTVAGTGALAGKTAGSGKLNGRTGTSIYYTDAYNIARANGYEGTVEEWLESLHGMTPHIGENGNWWIGETDTGVQAQGKQGPVGPQGPQGPDGIMTFEDLSEADKEKLVADVIAALPIYNGEVEEV